MVSDGSLIVWFGGEVSSKVDDAVEEKGREDAAEKFDTALNFLPGTEQTEAVEENGSDDVVGNPDELVWLNGLGSMSERTG